jgi:hypothetical protein
MDAVWRHEIGLNEETHRVSQVEDRTFGKVNRHLYYNSDNPPLPLGDPRLDERPMGFKAL